MSRRKDHALTPECLEDPKTPARTSSSSVSAEASAPVPELVLYPTNPSSTSTTLIGPQLPQRYEPALTPSLISAILAQGIVAFPVVWLFLGTLNQPPQPLVFYVLLVLLPPAGITWSILIFLKLRLYPAWGWYFASFFLVPPFFSHLPGPDHGLYVVALTAILAGYYSGVVVAGYIDMWRQSRMSDAEYVVYLARQRAIEKREQQNAVAGDALALVLLILLGLAIVAFLAISTPPFGHQGAYDMTPLIVPVVNVTAGGIVLSVVFKRILKVRAWLVVVVVIGLAGVLVVVGWPVGYLLVPSGVLGFGLGDVLVSSLGVYARELQGSVRRKTQRRSPR